MKLVKLMRGLPGCGKSYIARREFPNALILSTDDFYVVNGKYEFLPEKLSQYHNATVRKFIDALAAGVETIVVDNTNLRITEVILYYRLAEVFFYDVQVVHILADPEVCMRMNTHGVPPGAIEKMAKAVDALPDWVNVRTIVNF